MEGSGSNVTEFVSIHTAGGRRERGERNGVAADAAMTKVEKRGGRGTEEGKDRQKTSRLNLRLFPDN